MFPVRRLGPAAFLVLCVFGLCARVSAVVAPMHVPIPDSVNYIKWETFVGRDVSHIREVFAEARA